MWSRYHLIVLAWSNRPLGDSQFPFVLVDAMYEYPGFVSTF
ncbi:hypothetical protein ABNB59_06150 [Paenibacillus larvae]|nr:transposase [Paenibacillus larvae]MCY7477620.1 transposase [Paenibacillus larvae]MCY7489600.1 transposase [Paenibacillus larvae]MCY9562431.1 transposase [Paenibacillus larvae]MCY9570705.1 transposase [Paenibacillus larvae]MCY9711263.1 transposase [Paenibacillus larvae]